MPIGGSKRRLFQARSFKLDDHEHHAQADAYWRMVLKDLQRGHKREIAKQEQHYANRSLCCLNNTNSFRGLMIKFIEWPWFDRFILFVILLNCCISVVEDGICKCKGFQGKCAEDEKYNRLLYVTKECEYYPDVERVINDSDMIFLIIFTLELACKVAARGFIVHPHAYLRESVNWLDFIVVVTGLLSAVSDAIQSEDLQGLAFFDVLRLMRVFRPLRTMTRIPGMKTLIVTLGRSLKALSNVVFLLVFFMGIAGIMSIDLLAGSLRGRCFIDPDQTFSPAVKSRLESQQYPYLATSTVNEFGWNAGVDVCSATLPCDPMVLDGIRYNSTCRDQPLCASADAQGALVWNRCNNDWMPNPHDMGGGYFSYDNIVSSMFLLVSHITMEGWTDVMYAVGTDNERKWISRIFHSVWVLLGAFFVVQLALAVIADKYFHAQEEDKMKDAMQAMNEEAILQTEAISRHNRDLKRKASKLSRRRSIMGGLSGADFFSVKGLQKVFTKIKQILYQGFQSIPGLVPLHALIKRAWTSLRAGCRVLVNNPHFASFILLAIVINTVCMAIEHHDQSLFEASICQRRCDLDPKLPWDSSCTGPLFNRTFDLDENGQRVRYPQGKSFCLLNSHPLVAESALCGELTTREACYAMSSNCFWVKETIDLFGAADPNFKPCKLGLYTAEGFGQEAIFKGGDFRTLSFRHLCSDDGGSCPNFNTTALQVTTLINEVLSIIFIIEMVLKLLGLGVFGEGSYFENNWNCLDFVIVNISIIEYVILIFDPSATSGTFSILRSLRLFRLFKLLRNWTAMTKILGTLASALRALQLVFFLFVLVSYIFALLMMDRFGGGFKQLKTENPRSNFDSFFPSDTGHGAFMTVFQIVTTENWTTIMYNCITAYNGSDGSLAHGLFAVMVVVIGNYVIMNLFVAILLSKMDEADATTAEELDEHDEDDSSEQDTLARMGESLKHMGTTVKRMGTGLTPAKTEEDSGVLAAAKRLVGMSRQGAVKPSMAIMQGGSLMNQGSTLRLQTNDAFSSSQAPSFDLRAMSALEIKRTDVDTKTVCFELQETWLRFLSSKNKQQYIHVSNHNAMGCLPPKHPFRLLVAYISHHYAFDKFILVCILVSSMMLVLEAFNPRMSVLASRCPLDGLDCSGRSPGQVSIPNVNEDYVCPRNAHDEGFGEAYGPCGSATEPPCCSDVRTYGILTQMDTIFTVIFVMELVFKVMTDGLLMHKLAYLRNSWNVLDFFVVGISVTSLILSNTASSGGESIKALKALRAFRVLRPLRVVKRQPQLKTTVLCIISSFPAMITVAVVLMLYLFVMGMFTVQLFKGRFYRCFDPTDQIYHGTTPYALGNLYTASAPLSGPTAVPTMVECASKTQGQGIWQDSLFTFNNLFAAMLTLFELATTEGWLHMISYMVDVPSGPGITPLPNSQPFYAVLGFLHIMMGSFVLLNLLVSMIINGYSRIKNENDGMSTMITQEQREWIETKLMILEMAPTSVETGPEGKFRKFFYKIAQNPWFDFWITMCILANFGAMLSKKHDDSCEHNVVMFWLNFGFAVVFVAEAIIKLIGLGKLYFKDPWNRTDFAIVCLSNITIAIDFATNQHLCSADDATAAVPGLGVLRAFRIARVFRLVKQFKQLNTMIRTLITSLPALANIMSLICLFLLIFAVLGNTLFWNVSDDQDLYGGIDSDGNYAHFGNAFFLLWRQTTGEVWNSIMYYCSQSDLNLACSDTLDDYRTTIGCGMPELGTAYHILWQFIGTYLMMQLITAVILENFLDAIRDDSAIISKPARDDFVEKWGRFDPHATATMSTSDLPKLLCELNPPLGVKADTISSIKLLAVIKDLAIPVRGDKVRYKDTFLALVRRAQAYFPEEGEEEDDIFADSEEEEEEGDLPVDPYATESDVPHSTSHRRSSPSQRHLDVDEEEGGEVGAGAETAGGADDEEAKMFRGRRATIAEDYAARLLQVAYKQWKENRLQVHKTRFIQKEIPLSISSKLSSPRSRLSSERSSRPNLSQNGHAKSEPVRQDVDAVAPV